LGAGAIFRDGISVKGVTTASIIWISAAIGMACGIAQYEFAIMVTLSVMIILLGFTGIQKFIDQYNRELEYVFTVTNETQILQDVEELIRSHKLRFERTGIQKQNNQLTLTYDIKGGERQHEAFIKSLQHSSVVVSFKV